MPMGTKAACLILHFFIPTEKLSVLYFKLMLQKKKAHTHTLCLIYFSNTLKVKRDTKARKYAITVMLLSMFLYVFISVLTEFIFLILEMIITSNHNNKEFIHLLLYTVTEYETALHCILHLWVMQSYSVLKVQTQRLVYIIC
jgi:hypothetical protein